MEKIFTLLGSQFEGEQIQDVCSNPIRLEVILLLTFY
jgi:hypothetical protein